MMFLMRPGQGGNIECIEDAADGVTDTRQDGDLQNTCGAECLLGLAVQIIIDVMAGRQRPG
jgi:hypothetical protein